VLLEEWSGVTLVQETVVLLVVQSGEASVLLEAQLVGPSVQE
jgi:hypothetical protein